MEDQEQILSQALQKAVQIVETVEDRYREPVIPIILQAIIDGSTEKLNTPQKGSNPGTNGHQTSTPSLPPTLSVNEFFRRVNPDSHPARFVTAAYYLFHAKSMEQFTQADILDIYRKLRQQQPKNPTDVMNQCIRKAHVIDAPLSDKQKQWVITPDGEKFVEDLLHDNTNSSNAVAR